jgi:hypothetical protein
LARGYVKREGKAMMPTPLGEVTNKLMEENFPDIVNYEFTAAMETDLDKIEHGSLKMNSVLSTFYKGFDASLTTAQEKISKEDISIPAESSSYTCVFETDYKTFINLNSFCFSFNNFEVNSNCISNFERIKICSSL